MADSVCVAWLTVCAWRWNSVCVAVADGVCVAVADGVCVAWLMVPGTCFAVRRPSLVVAVLIKVI